MVFVKVVRKHVFGSREALMCLIKGWGLRDEWRGSRRRVLSRKGGGVIGDEILGRISRSGGLIWGCEGKNAGFCCELS